MSPNAIVYASFAALIVEAIVFSVVMARAPLGRNLIGGVEKCISLELFTLFVFVAVVLLAFLVFNSGEFLESHQGGAASAPAHATGRLVPAAESKLFA